MPVQFRLADSPQIVSKDVIVPESTSLTLAGTGEVIQVYEGVVELRMPISINGDMYDVQTEIGEIKLAGEIEWQTCDDQTCDLPRKEAFDLTVPVSGFVVSELRIEADGDLVRKGD